MFILAIQNSSFYYSLTSGERKFVVCKMPKPLNSQCQRLVASLIRYFEKERENKGPLLPLTAVREVNYINIEDV